MRFQDLPLYTRTASYVIDVFWDHLEVSLERYSEDGKGWNGLDLDPPYQRAHVWNETKQRQYVEYILRGGKSSRDLYFNHPNWMGNFRGVLELVDGKQRLEAVRKFLRNELRIFPSVLNDQRGFLYSDFTDGLPIHAGFKFHINDLKTRKEVLQWYLDLNEGGVVHTEEELSKVREMLNSEV